MGISEPSISTWGSQCQALAVDQIMWTKCAEDALNQVPQGAADDHVDDVSHESSGWGVTTFVFVISPIFLDCTRRYIVFFLKSRFFVISMFCPFCKQMSVFWHTHTHTRSFVFTDKQEQPVWRNSTNMLGCNQLIWESSTYRRLVKRALVHHQQIWCAYLQCISFRLVRC